MALKSFYYTSDMKKYAWQNCINTMKQPHGLYNTTVLQTLAFFTSESNIKCSKAMVWNRITYGQFICALMTEQYLPPIPRISVTTSYWASEFRGPNVGTLATPITTYNTLRKPHKVYLCDSARTRNVQIFAKAIIKLYTF